MEMYQEQAFQVAMLYINGTNADKEKILYCFNADEREIFLRGVSTIKLFTDAEYYETVKCAVRDRICKELYKS